MKRPTPYLLVTLVLILSSCRPDSKQQAQVTDDTSPLTVAVNGRLVKVLIDSLRGCQGDPATITYDTTLGSIGTYTHVFDSTDFMYGSERMIALTTRLSPSDTFSYTFAFDSGPSCDPSFYFTSGQVMNESHLLELQGTDLSIPGDGFIYVNGKADDYFYRYRKYRLQNGLPREIPQPFYYVGLRSIALDTLVLYSDEALKTPQSIVSPGDSLTVLISRTKNLFLIKAEDGVVGWAYIDTQIFDRTSVQDLYYHGD